MESKRTSEYKMTMVTIEDLVQKIKIFESNLSKNKVFNPDELQKILDHIGVFLNKNLFHWK
jgi:hypothetical protein